MDGGTRSSWKPSKGNRQSLARLSRMSNGTTTAPFQGGALLAEFPAPGFDAWRNLVQTELKDVPFEKKMLSSTYEGIKLSALYRKEDVAKLPHIHSLPGF